MKRIWGTIPLLIGLCLNGMEAYAQGDLAVHGTFVQYSAAVYSIQFEIPQDMVEGVIKSRVQNTIDQMRNSIKNSELIEGATTEIGNLNLFDQMLKQYEIGMNQLLNQSMQINRLIQSGFAIDPYHVVTIGHPKKIPNPSFNPTIKNATINIIDDHKRPIPVEMVNMDELTGVLVLRRKEGTFSKYVDINTMVTPLPLPEGSYIMSIERPYELPASPISGMIGGYDRALNLFPVERYIQTDIKLYPNNEGAPVFSPSGHLIGMIAAEYYVGRYPGVTFLIPSDILVDSAADIIKNGRRIRGWIPGLLQLGRSPGVNGVIITQVDTDNPISKDIANGDIITGIDGVRASEGNNLYYKILSTKPNQNVTIEVQRGNNTRTFTIKTQEMPDDVRGK